MKNKNHYDELWFGMELSQYKLLLQLLRQRAACKHVNDISTVLYMHIVHIYKCDNVNERIVHTLAQAKAWPAGPHLFEFLCLSLTDRLLKGLHLQLGQLSCWDLQWELCILALVRQT